MLEPYQQVERLPLSCALGSGLREWFETSGRQNLAKIKQPILILQMAASMIKGPHISRVEVYYRLGESHLSSARYHKSRGLESDDVAKAFISFTECLHSLGSPPSLRIKGGYIAARIQHGLGHLREALSLHRECIEIFPFLAARALSDSDREYTVRSAVRGIAASATALSLHLGDEPYGALKFLEIGRNFFANVAMELDVNDVLLDPNLLSKFRDLRLSLENLRQQPIPNSSNQVSSWLSSSTARY